MWKYSQSHKVATKANVQETPDVQMNNERLISDVLNLNFACRNVQ